jgi:hypothetical protein
MSNADLFWLLLKIAGLLTGVGLIRWQLGRRPYRDGYRIRMTPPSQPEDAGAPARPPLAPETHTEWIGVPCDPGLDYSRLNDALNRQDTSVTDHRDQDDDHPGPSWGIIR